MEQRIFPQPCPLFDYFFRAADAMFFTSASASQVTLTANMAPPKCKAFLPTCYKKQRIDACTKNLSSMKVNVKQYVEQIADIRSIPFGHYQLMDFTQMRKIHFFSQEKHAQQQTLARFIHMLDCLDAFLRLTMEVINHYIDYLSYLKKYFSMKNDICTNKRSSILSTLAAKNLVPENEENSSLRVLANAIMEYEQFQNDPPIPFAHYVSGAIMRQSEIRSRERELDDSIFLCPEDNVNAATDIVLCCAALLAKGMSNLKSKHTKDKQKDGGMLKGIYSSIQRLDFIVRKHMSVTDLVCVAEKFMDAHTKDSDFECFFAPYHDMSSVNHYFQDPKVWINHEGFLQRVRQCITHVSRKIPIITECRDYLREDLPDEVKQNIPSEYFSHVPVNHRALFKDIFGALTMCQTKLEKATPMANVTANLPSPLETDDPYHRSPSFSPPSKKRKLAHTLDVTRDPFIFDSRLFV